MPTEAETALHRFLVSQGLTIAAAESLTVGKVQSHLGSCSGSSAYFKGGICAYTIHAKVEHLGVDGKHAAEVNCVSYRVARQMALGVREMFGSDVGISTTGYAEPDPDNGVGAPFAWVGVSCLDRHAEFSVEGSSAWSREAVQRAVARKAIEHLIEWLQGGS